MQRSCSTIKRLKHYPCWTALWQNSVWYENVYIIEVSDRMWEFCFDWRLMNIYGNQTAVMQCRPRCVWKYITFTDADFFSEWGMLDFIRCWWKKWKISVTMLETLFCSLKDDLALLCTIYLLFLAYWTQTRGIHIWCFPN